MVDSYDPDYYFVYDTRWRIVGTFRESDSTPKEQFVYHNAGLGGSGSASYIDTVILRDRDDSNGWAGSADGTLEERVYECQNWRADVSALITDAGGKLETVKYSSYGVPFCMPAGDTDVDGDADSTDRTQIQNWSGGSDIRGDLDLDGDVDAADETAFLNGPSGELLGRGVLSRSDVAGRKGYAGYEWDQSLPEILHIRNRVLNADLGRWMQRDPLGDVDGPSLYAYARTNPMTLLDPLGTRSGPLQPGTPVCDNETCYTTETSYNCAQTIINIIDIDPYVWPCTQPPGAELLLDAMDDCTEEAEKHGTQDPCNDENKACACQDLIYDTSWSDNYTITKNYFYLIDGQLCKYCVELTFIVTKFQYWGTCQTKVAGFATQSSSPGIGSCGG